MSSANSNIITHTVKYNCIPYPIKVIRLAYFKTISFPSRIIYTENDGIGRWIDRIGTKKKNSLEHEEHDGPEYFKQLPKWDTFHVMENPFPQSCTDHILGNYLTFKETCIWDKENTSLRWTTWNITGGNAIRLEGELILEEMNGTGYCVGKARFLARPVLQHTTMRMLLRDKRLQWHLKRHFEQNMDEKYLIQFVERTTIKTDK